MQAAPNDIKRHPTAVLGIVLVLGATAGLGTWLLGVALAVLDAARAGVPVPPAHALTGALAGLGAATTGWLVLGIVLEVLARVPGTVGVAAGRTAAALSPLVVRRVVALVLGASIGTGAVGAAHATPQGVLTSVTSSDAVTPGATSDLPDPSWTPGPGPDPGWTPEQPRVRPQPDVRVLTGAPRAEDRSGDVVVHRGDSLWTVAARHLGEGASDAEIAAEWPRWYAANRHVVGPDPDLLHPGQVLRSPAAADDTAAVTS